jgi:SAM-dependent methyltransferase
MTTPPAVAPMPTAVRPKARESIHSAILKWFDARKRGRVLDAPAGYGHLSMKLKDLGFDVVCGEIDPEIFAVPELSCVYTDLNRKIDAADASFDYVTCVDGLEHMTDPYTAVAEFARVLKPGGYGVFSIPNYCNIEKRIKFLWHGYLTKPHTIEKFEREGRNLFNFHNSPLTITLLDLMFSINGLELLEIRRNALKRKQYFFLPLVWLMKFSAMFQSPKSKRKHRTDLTLKGEVVLGGNNMILITQKK